MSIALNNNIKLFYRPTGFVAEAVKSVGNTVSVSVVNGQLQFANPSGYYLTFSSLSVGGRKVADDALRAMVPPKGVQHYPLPAGIKSGVVRWTLIDEYGLKTDEFQQTVH